MPNDTDFDKVERWAQGDKRAAEDLYRRHRLSVYRFFELRLPDQAEDLTQKTFLACLEALQRRELHTSFRSYLFGIARNQMLMHLRKASRVTALRSFDNDGERPSRQTSLTSVFARTEEQQLLLAAMVDLPADLQMTMQLYYWDGLRAAEIGEVFGVPASTVTTRLSRARQLIREHLQQVQVSPALTRTIDGELPRWTRSLVEPKSESG